MITSGLPLQTTHSSQDIDDTEHPSCATAPPGLGPRLATTKQHEVNHAATTESTRTFEFSTGSDVTRTTVGNDNNNAQSMRAGKQNAKSDHLRVYFSPLSVTLHNDLSHALSELTADAMNDDANGYPTGITSIPDRHNDHDNAGNRDSWQPAGASNITAKPQPTSNKATTQDGDNFDSVRCPMAT